MVVGCFCSFSINIQCYNMGGSVYKERINVEKKKRVCKSVREYLNVSSLFIRSFSFVVPRAPGRALLYYCRGCLFMKVRKIRHL